LIPNSYVLINILALALPAYAGQLNDHYLAAFGQQPGSALGKTVLQVVETSGSHCGTPLKHGLSHESDYRLKATLTGLQTR
jgi:hypothetical protein